MSWAQHGVGAVKIGAELIGAGCAAMVHAVVPGWFTETAGRTVTRSTTITSRAQGGRRQSGELARL